MQTSMNALGDLSTVPPTVYIQVMDDAESESVSFLIGRYVQNDSSLKPNRRAWYIELNGGYPGFCCRILIV